MRLDRHTGRMPGKVSGKLLELSENTLLHGLNTQPWLYFVTVDIAYSHDRLLGVSTLLS